MKNPILELKNIDLCVSNFSINQINLTLYPDQNKGYGREIVTQFQYGGFKDVYAFERFVVRFDNKHFQYVKKDGIEILKLTKYCRAKGLNFENSLTDYVYIINESDLDMEMRYTKNNKELCEFE